jgi:pseudouridine kinase
MIDHITTREKEILEILKKDPMISQDTLAEKLKITRSAAAVHISNLMRKGYIAGRGYIFDERGGILVVGKTLLEVRAGADRISRDERETGSIELACSGNGYLLALELAQRNLEPGLLTSIGRDEIGEQILGHLIKKGINVQYTIRNPDNRTGRRLVFSNSRGITCTVEDDESDLFLDEEALSSKEGLIAGKKLLLIDGEISLKSIEYLAARAISSNIITSAVRCPLSVLKKVGLLTHPQFFLVCTARDLAAQAGKHPFAEPEEMFPLCRQIVGEGCYALVVIFGDQGVILATGEETAYLPASPLKAPGTDLNVAAGIAEGLLAGFRMRMAVRKTMGSAAAG